MAPLTQLISTRWPEVITFILVFGRAGGLIVSAPFWGSQVIPVLVRVWIAMLLAIATYPLVRVVSLPGGITLLSLLMALGGEILLGLVLGWMAQLLFAAMRLAGQEIEIKSLLSGTQADRRGAGLTSNPLRRFVNASYRRFGAILAKDVLLVNYCRRHIWAADLGFPNSWSYSLSFSSFSEPNNFPRLEKG